MKRNALILSLALTALGPSAVAAQGTAALDATLAVLVSDLHVNGEKPTHTTAELKKTVDAILAMRPLPAHVVVLGDVADTHGKACDYAAADPLLKPLEDAGIVVDWMMGNHDHRAAFAAFRPAYAKTTLVPGRQVHVVALPSFDLVLMDSLIEGEGEGSFNEVNGEVDGGQCEWLADYGARAKRPFVVCTHHDGRQMKRFAKAAMASSPKMVGYLHGHRHSWMPDALHVWGGDARLVRSAGVPSAAAWGDIGYALLRDCGDRAELTVAVRDGWFPKPPATEATRRIARENDGTRIVFAFGDGASAASAAGPADPSLAKRAYADSLKPILPGWGRHFWNQKSVWYLYPPAFDFTNVANAVAYRFEILNDRHDRLSFTAAKPTESLEDVWSRIPARGFVTVSCFGVAADGRVCGEAGSPRTFWKNPPFDPAKCEPGASSYAESALRQYEYVFSLPHVQKMVETGKLDYTYPHNCYPTKMNACLIASALHYGELKPSERERALKVACAAADCLIDLAEPEGAPLAGFTPTYAKDSKLHSAGRYAGQNMLSYPATAGCAFLTLHAATRNGKYLGAAKRIADTYLRLQGEDGTWYLKLREKDGTPVNPNRLLPIGVCSFLLECSRVSGDPKYREAADRAFAYVEKGPLANWNWEGQFEDVEPSRMYQNLTHHPPCDAALFLLDRYPGDKARLAQARALLKFSEDQFVAWERPCRADGTTVHSPRLETMAGKWPVLPVTLEQYSWYVPVNASLAKMISTYLALYAAERDPLDLAKAKALGDACTRAQCDSGCIPSEWMGPIDRKSSFPTWINCQIETAEALERLAAAERRTP